MEAISDRLQVGNIYEGVCGDEGIYYMVKAIGNSPNNPVTLLKANNGNLNDPMQPHASHYVLAIRGDKYPKEISFPYDTKVEEVTVDACKLTDEMMRFHASSVYNPMLQYKSGINKYQYDNECGVYNKGIGLNIGYYYKVTVNSIEHNIIIIKMAKARTRVLISGLVVYDGGFTESISYGIGTTVFTLCDDIKDGDKVYCEIDTIKERARLPYQEFKYIKDCYDNGIKIRIDKDIATICQ